MEIVRWFLYAKKCEGEDKTFPWLGQRFKIRRVVFIKILLQYIFEPILNTNYENSAIIFFPL
jgi:hypothetical protein